MEYRILKNGLKISAASFGCMSLNPEGSNNDALIGKAIDNGINLFDTADLYDKGGNEILLGKALKGRRQDVVVSTKVGNKWRPDGSGWDWLPGKKYIMSAIDDSLRRLNTDYIDLYLLHGGTIQDPVDEVVEAFERLVENGKIKSYGLSSIRPNVIREYIKRSKITAVMTQYSILDRRPEESTLELLHQNEIGVLARGTLASGLLAGKPAKAYLGLAEDKIKFIQEALAARLPEAYSSAETALRYVIDRAGVTSAVVGIRTESQLLQVLSALDKAPFASHLLKDLEEIWEGNRYEEHI